MRKILVWIQKLLGFLASRRFLTLMARHGRWISVAALVIALLCFVVVAFELETLSKVSAQILGRQGEPVPQQYGALDSLALSIFDEDQLAQKISSSASAQIVNIKKKLEAIDDHKITEAMKSHTRFGNNFAVFPKINGPVPPLHDQYISDTNPDASLFLPGVSLVTSANGGQGISQKQVHSYLQKDRQLYADIYASAIIANELKAFSQTEIFDGASSPRPVQAYFISRKGVLRIWSSGSSPSRHDIPFLTHRLFSERPYFWRTIDASNGKDRHSFPVHTKPYIDLLGHGVVVTLCDAVGPTHVISEAVICVDVGYKDQQRLVEELTKQLRPFLTDRPDLIGCKDPKGNWQTFECSSADGPRVANQTDKINAIQTQLGALNGRPEPMLSGIFPIQRNWASRPWLARLTDVLASEYPSFRGALSALVPAPNVRTFTIPVGISPSSQASSQGSLDGPRQVMFLLCQIDLSAPRSILVYATAFCLLFASTGFLSILFLHHMRVLALTFVESLQVTMAVSPTPFLHLDEMGYVLSANQSFRQITGYSGDFLLAKTFSDLLADQESKTRYDAVAKLRSELKITLPYEVRLSTCDGRSIRMIAAGCPLYMPRKKVGSIDHRPKSNSVPSFVQTFGIFVPTQKLRRKQMEYLSLDLEFVTFEARLQQTAVPVAVIGRMVPQMRETPVFVRAQLSPNHFPIHEIKEQPSSAFDHGSGSELVLELRDLSAPFTRNRRIPRLADIDPASLAAGRDSQPLAFTACKIVREHVTGSLNSESLEIHFTRNEFLRVLHSLRKERTIEIGSSYSVGISGWTKDNVQIFGVVEVMITGNLHDFPGNNQSEQAPAQSSNLARAQDTESTHLAR